MCSDEDHKDKFEVSTTDGKRQIVASEGERALANKPNQAQENGTSLERPRRGGGSMFAEQIISAKWLLKTAKGFRRWLALSVLLSVAAGAAWLVPPLIIHRVASALLLGLPLPGSALSSALLLVIAIVAHYLLVFAATELAHTVAFRLYDKLRGDIIELLGRLPLGFFTAGSSGAIKKIMSDDIEKLEIYVGHHLPDLVRAAIVPVVALAIVARHGALPTLCVAIPVIVAGVAMALTYRSQAGRMKEFHDNENAMNGAVVEYIKGMPVVKVFNMTMESYDRLKSAIVNQVEIAREWTASSVPFHALFKAGLDSAPVLLAPAAAMLASIGPPEPSGWLLALIISAAMIKPVEQIYTTSSLLATLDESVRRIDALMESKPMEYSDKPLTPHGFAISWKDVDFSFEGAETLKHVTFDVPERGLYALVGESGSGKSVAAQLMLRFWDVNSGSISVGGVDLRQIEQDCLMSTFAFVFQDTFIPDGTIAQNIALGRSVPLADIMRAAKQAGADEFINEMPLGYDTIIGPGGTTLSGGQNQRLSIARAICKNSPIMIFDEADSAIDPESRIRLDRTLMELAKAKTVLVITHRLRSAQRSDRVLFFHKGTLAANGNHDELLAQCSNYRKLWRNSMLDDGLDLFALENALAGDKA